MSESIKHTTIEKELKNGKTITYFTVGYSMRPLLAERKTHVTIAPLERTKNGDILLYIRKNGAYVLHRLMKQDEAYYYMRGDNTYGLEKIQKSQAIGVVTIIYKNGIYIDVNRSKKYFLYVKLWNLIYPLRWSLVKCRGILGKVKRYWKIRNENE